MNEFEEYISHTEQSRTALEDKVKNTSRYIIDNAESVLGIYNDDVWAIVDSITELLKRLDDSPDFLENDLCTNIGRLFVQKVLLVVARIQEYLAGLSSSEQNERTITICSEYCGVLTRYASRIHTL